MNQKILEGHNAFLQRPNKSQNDLQQINVPSM